MALHAAGLRGPGSDKHKTNKPKANTKLKVVKNPTT